MNRVQKVAVIIFLIVSVAGDNAMSMTDWIFSNTKYKKNITAECYLVTEDQICGLFAGDEVIQHSYKELEKIQKYLVVRLKNTGGSTAWGSFNCGIDGHIAPPVVFGLNANMKKFVNFVIPIEMGVIFPVSGSQPRFAIEWKTLYCK